MASKTNKEMFIEELEAIAGEYPEMPELLSYLENSDFYTAPLTNQVAYAFQGGACTKSLNNLSVAHELVKSFTPVLSLDIPPSSVVLAALLAEIGIANAYVIESRNRKNKATGAWEEYDYWNYDPLFPLEPNYKAVFIATQFIKLPPDVAQAIIYAKQIPTEQYIQKTNYFKAMKQPLTAITHSACELSLHLLDVTEIV